MPAPLVTIIIPCFNAHHYVSQAIQSALGQTYMNREVIVVDDGSTDGSLDVIRSFGEAVIWETGSNRGGGAARNRGLARARGDLIQFLDADDWLHANKLERQVELALQDPGRIVYCDYETQWEEDCDGTAMRSPDSDGLDPVVFILAKAGLQTAGPLHWKESLLKINGFREDLPCAQERDLHLRLACSGMHFRHLPEVLFSVRRRSGSLSSDSIRVLDQHAQIAFCAYELLRDWGGLTEERRIALASFLATDARAYLKYGLPKKAHAYFARAGRFHRDAGISQAYSRRTRWLFHTLGPSFTERLVGWKRSLAPASTK